MAPLRVPRRISATRSIPILPVVFSPYTIPSQHRPVLPSLSVPVPPILPVATNNSPISSAPADEGCNSKKSPLTETLLAEHTSDDGGHFSYVDAARISARSSHPVHSRLGLLHLDHDADVTPTSSGSSLPRHVIQGRQAPVTPTFVSVPNSYGAMYTSLSPGAVVGITLAAVIGVLLILGLIYGLAALANQTGGFGFGGGTAHSHVAPSVSEVRTATPTATVLSMRSPHSIRRSHPKRRSKRSSHHSSSRRHSYVSPSEAAAPAVMPEIRTERNSTVIDDHHRRRDSYHRDKERRRHSSYHRDWERKHERTRPLADPLVVDASPSRHHGHHHHHHHHHQSYGTGARSSVSGAQPIPPQEGLPPPPPRSEGSSSSRQQDYDKVVVIEEHDPPIQSPSMVTPEDDEVVVYEEHEKSPPWHRRRNSRHSGSYSRQSGSYEHRGGRYRDVEYDRYREAQRRSRSYSRDP